MLPGPRTPRRALVAFAGQEALPSGAACPFWGCQQYALSYKVVSKVMTVRHGRSVFCDVPELSVRPRDVGHQTHSQLCLPSRPKHTAVPTPPPLRASPRLSDAPQSDFLPQSFYWASPKRISLRPSLSLSTHVFRFLWWSWELPFGTGPERCDVHWRVILVIPARPRAEPSAQCTPVRLITFEEAAWKWCAQPLLSHLSQLHIVV